MRTFEQFGIGFDTNWKTPEVVISAKVDGVEVYEGAVSTIDKNQDELDALAPDALYEMHQPLFTWQRDIDFAGTCLIEITVYQGSLCLAHTRADRNASQFDTSYRDVGDIVSDIMRDGEPVIKNPAQVRTGAEDISGQWSWYLYPMQPFSFVLNIAPGTIILPWQSDIEYVQNAQVIHGGTGYIMYAETCPAGTSVTNESYWWPFPLN